MSGYSRRDSEPVTRRWNRVFEALSAEPRRQLVDALSDVSGGESVALPDAAATPDVQADSDQLRLELRHQHLPVLAAAEYVEWQRTPFQASRGSRFDEVEVVLESLHRNASEIPDRLVGGYRTLEREREQSC